MKTLMRSALAILAVGLLIGSVQAADDTYAHQMGLVETVDTVTIDAQLEDYGSWVRACSTGTFGTLDSGAIVTVITGTANLGQGQVLYIGLDEASGATDTILGFTEVSLPVRAWGKVKLPFMYTKIVRADSNVTAPARVATFATKGSTDKVLVENLTIQVYMLSRTIN